MRTLLQLDSSADLVSSRSRRITAAFAEAWRDAGGAVVVRDLHAHPLPHLATPAQHWPERLRSEAVPAELDAVQQQVLEELFAADVLLIGAPMYNYSMPAVLKNWIDLIHVPGVTAPFDGDTQPMKGRAAVIVTSRGATYDAGSPTEGWDHVVPPLSLVLGNSLGMEVRVIATSRTLADTVPAMAAERERADAELAAALTAARELATSL
ncbi:NAD(P)H-dependent oxidoreductase [Microbacteriaceae bacterium VKM Ac-2855]|nr:NAD(P)H-dependent oxidoreductase [Microbacteriaceae bacterium VKM Ac-2855]